MPRTAFRPETDGFAFVNSWSFDRTETEQIRRMLEASLAAAASPLPGLGQIFDRAEIRDVMRAWVARALPDGYGLCGGMAFAALDYYRAGIPCPRGAGARDIPSRRTSEGAALRSYLWRRLLDSLRSNGSTFITWMAMLHLVPDQWPFNGGSDWLHEQSNKEWKKLKASIDAGRPLPIGLVGSSADPFDNHQVVASGYQNSGGEAVIYVYDMNCPGRENRIELNLDSPPLAGVRSETCRSSGRGPLRGFFCERYRSAAPPRLEWPVQPVAIANP